MLFTWWKNRRRRRILANAFPSGWLKILDDTVGHYHVLTETDRARLRDTIQILIAEKDWEGCRGLEMTDTIRVTVAALAGVMILGLSDFYFENVQTVLVYPSEYVVKQKRAIVGDLVLHEDSERLGEAHHHGPIILSWDEVQANAREPGFGQNLVFHEFAHKLDMRNGEMDGTPDMPTRDLSARWSRIMNEEFRRLQRAERHGRETLIDPYGASEPAEFFAVVTECFFDSPQAMKAEHPVLYELFGEYYHQDPASWPAFPNLAGH